MVKLFKGRGFNAGNILTLVVTAAILLFFIGKVIVPFISPLFGGSEPDWAVLENIDVQFWFGVAFTTVVLLFVINVFMKEKLSGRTIAMAILLGIAVWYLATNYDIFSWLNASLASAQSLFIP